MGGLSSPTSFAPHFVVLNFVGGAIAPHFVRSFFFTLFVPHFVHSPTGLRPGGAVAGLSVGPKAPLLAHYVARLAVLICFVVAAAAVSAAAALTVDGLGGHPPRASCLDWLGGLLIALVALVCLA